MTQLTCCKAAIVIEFEDVQSANTNRRPSMSDVDWKEIDVGQTPRLILCLDHGQSMLLSMMVVPVVTKMSSRFTRPSRISLLVPSPASFLFR